MLFAAKTYDEQYNAIGINNMEQLSCHYSPLPVCGTIERNVINNFNKNKTATNTTTTTQATKLAVKVLQEKRRTIQYDNESLQIFEDSKHLPLKPLKVIAEDDVKDFSHPPNVRNDSTRSISCFKYPKGQQGHFYRVRFTLFLHSIDLRRQPLQNTRNNARLITWRNSQLAI